ncbi:M48 family metallopeptidase [Paenibacillus chartarius]|uniref:M48 family metallopeptidase n=1 Tax=Paenibacillus chartarius TaxID=747481 RepID=A0ABV6DGA2_9BACL
MKRWTARLVIGMLLYGVVIGLYFTFGNLYEPSPQYAGTAADPSTFLAPEQIRKGESLSRIHSLAYFIMTPLQVVVLLLLLGFGVGLRTRLERLTRFSLLRIGGFVLVFLAVTGALFLPLDYAMLQIDRAYGLSTTTTATFFADLGKDLAIEWVSTTFIVVILLWLMRRSPKRWWLWLSIVAIPISVFLTFVQPVVLDPLYHTFQPLRKEPLRTEILELAAKADIPANQVFEVNMSERTNAVNAYVNGIGSNARIVLWDTTLNKLKDDEILTIMAHEMGHYKEKHIYWQVAVGIIVTFFSLWAAYRLYEWLLRKAAPLVGIRQGGKGQDLAALPVLLIAVSLVGIVLTPAQNVFSRFLEQRADAYAMQMTGDGDAAIRAFQKIARDNLSPIKQPLLVTLFRGTHPSIQDRILYFSQFEK